MEFHILGAATRKARAPNERLCRGTESDWQFKYTQRENRCKNTKPTLKS